MKVAVVAVCEYAETFLEKIVDEDMESPNYALPAGVLFALANMFSYVLFCVRICSYMVLYS